MTELQFTKTENGLLITSEDGKFVFTPTGLLDLSGILSSSEKISPPDLLISPRSKRFLVSLSQNGEMFVSPAGEVDFSAANFKEKERLIVSPKEKLVVAKDGKVEKTFNENEGCKLVPNLSAENSLMTHLENGEFVFCPSGNVRVPDNMHTFAITTKDWLMDLHPDGNLSVLTSNDNIAVLAEKWIQLF